MIHSIENIIFLITWFGLITFAIMLMSNGWRIMESNSDEEKFKNIHPELEGLKEGDELLVVNFNQIPDPRVPKAIEWINVLIYEFLMLHNSNMISDILS